MIFYNIVQKNPNSVWKISGESLLVREATNGGYL